MPHTKSARRFGGRFCFLCVGVSALAQLFLHFLQQLLMLIMDIFGNFPYLFPIMVTGWLAMQACSKMVTGSADLKD